MRLNSHEEEVIGQGTLSQAATGSAPTTTASSEPHGQLAHVGCPRFGQHRADAHRESEILGGAFQHE